MSKVTLIVPLIVDLLEQFFILSDGSRLPLSHFVDIKPQLLILPFIFIPFSFNCILCFFKLSLIILYIFSSLGKLLSHLV